VSLILDENLSRRLATRLADVFPNARHVVLEGLERAADTEIWARAAADGLTIVTRDYDFVHRSLLFGPPPPVVWLRVGNASTHDVECIMRREQASIERLVQGGIPAGLLVIS
jgi:predicted nuclease of predicted toxin-antitoxin system